LFAVAAIMNPVAPWRWSVHYFYVALVSIGLLTAGGLWWQPQQTWLEQAAAITLGGTGVAILVAGIVSIAKREERKEKKRRTIVDHALLCDAAQNLCRVA
jgi:hypothetical protein